MPRVSVVMPVYNGAKHIRIAIESILSQTYTDWEMLIINEKGTTDSTVDIVEEYEKKDGRIRLIQNKERLGLSKSLNVGIKEAKGEYIARLDADDSSSRDRFEKQVKFLDDNPEIGVCGTWQHHFGKDEWTHTPPSDTYLCHAILLFDCNMCHSTVMIRKSVLEKNHIAYNENSAIEDFELWSRLMRVTRIANLPIILGEYLESGDNITLSKEDIIKEESATIIKDSLNYFFDILLEDDELKYFRFYERPLFGLDGEEKEKSESKCKSIIKKIYKRNQEVKFCNDEIMLHVLHYLWIRFCTGEYSFNNPLEKFDTIDDIFEIGVRNRGNMDYYSKINESLSRLDKDEVDKKIIIYPFGRRGKEVKYVLNNVCGIQEKYVVDNNPNVESDSDCKIITIDELSDKNLTDFTVLISSDNDKLYETIRNEVKRIKGVKRIIDVLAPIVKCDSEYIISSEVTYSLPIFSAIEMAARETYRCMLSGELLVSEIDDEDIVNCINRCFPNKKLFLHSVDNEEFCFICVDIGKTQEIEDYIESITKKVSTGGYLLIRNPQDEKVINTIINFCREKKLGYFVIPEKWKSIMIQKTT